MINTSDTQENLLDTAIIRLPDGRVIEGQCREHKVYTDGSAFITIGDTLYLTTLSNVCILIRRSA